MEQETIRSIWWSVPFCWNISIILSINISSRILKKTVWLVSGTQIRSKYIKQETTRSVLWSVRFCWNISKILNIQIFDRILKKTVWLVSETQIRRKYMKQETTRSVLWSAPFCCSISTILSIKISAWYYYELFPLQFQGKTRSNRIVLLSLFTLTLYLVVGLKLGTKDIQVPFFTASLLPLNNFRHPWKKQKSVKKESFISLVIHLANLKLDMEGIIKTIRGMIIEPININSFRMETFSCRKSAMQKFQFMSQ